VISHERLYPICASHLENIGRYKIYLIFNGAENIADMAQLLLYTFSALDTSRVNKCVPDGQGLSSLYSAFVKLQSNLLQSLHPQNVAQLPSEHFFSAHCSGFPQDPGFACPTARGQY